MSNKLIDDLKTVVAAIVERSPVDVDAIAPFLCEEGGAVARLTGSGYALGRLIARFACLADAERLHDSLVSMRACARLLKDRPDLKDQFLRSTVEFIRRVQEIELIDNISCDSGNRDFYQPQPNAPA